MERDDWKNLGLSNVDSLVDDKKRGTASASGKGGPES